MSLIVLAIVLVVVLVVLFNARRWRALGRGTRAFARRLEEGYRRPQLPGAKGAMAKDRGFGTHGGYIVLATDGIAGQVERLDTTTGELVITVDPLVEGRTVRVPQAAIVEVDRARARLVSDRSKEELASATRLRR
jgi:hypothetical protein